ncbi:MAG: EAL domain-containing protein [Curvibacter sp.]|nr:MAG: EAL domain-containing protein [Curvibacter sp.]
MLLALLQGGMLLLALSQLYGYSLRTRSKSSFLNQLVGGLLFGSACAIAMAMPLTPVPNLLVDARSIVLSMASLFGGPWVGAVAAIIALAYQGFLGGFSAPIATAVVLVCFGMGLAYHLLLRQGRASLGWQPLLLFGLLMHSVVVSLLSLAPGDFAIHAPLMAAVALMLVFSLATMVTGLILENVRKRQQAEADLVLKEMHLREILNATFDVQYVLDERGTIVEALSDSALLSAGGNASLVGKHLSEVLSPEEAEPLLLHLRRALALPGNHAFEFDLQSTHGVRRFAGRAHALPPVPGRPRSLALLGLDVTERMDALRALEASENRFRSLLQNVGAVAVQGYTPDGTITYWNMASERLYGYSAEEAMGRNFFILLVPHSLRSRLQEQMEDLQATSRVLDAQEMTLVHKQGHEVPILSSYAMVFANAKVAEFFRLDIDLAERRRTESELRVAATAFEAQEGMMVTNARREILRVNQAFTKISGYDAHEVIGKNPGMFSSGWHDDAFYTQMNEALDKEGHWEGEIWNRRKNGDVYPQLMHISSVVDDGGAVSHYVATQIDITQRKAAEDQVRQLAFYDTLTGLPNRRMLLDRLQHALASSARSGACGALLFIDLDHFKTLNDTLGHDKGDLLLQEVAQRLIDGVREEDTVARLGGDEYVVMLEGLDALRETAAGQATLVGEKIIATLSKPYRLAGHEYHSTQSMGLTLFSGHEAALEDLLKQADLAMYQAKNAGRNGLRFYDPLMQAAVTQRAKLEVDIRQGLLFGQYELYYQPQLNAQGRVLGAEALLRWNHPEHGMVSPAVFIPVAEESGQIVALGSWVLETACAQLVTWGQDPATEHLTLAVNVSSRQFRQQDFADHMLAMLDYTGANPKRLKLELTESMLVDNVEDLIEKMTALRARGVGFSLDDFGTGYSSLSYLKRLPLDQLKIDQSFVRDVLTDPNDAVIAKTIVTLGRSLGLAVIAEGVETAAQRDFLMQSGCGAFQGYLFSRPLPAQTFTVYLQSLQPEEHLE